MANYQDSVYELPQKLSAIEDLIADLQRPEQTKANELTELFSTLHEKICTAEETKKDIDAREVRYAFKAIIVKEFGDKFWQLFDKWEYENLYPTG